MQSKNQHQSLCWNYDSWVSFKGEWLELSNSASAGGMVISRLGGGQKSFNKETRIIEYKNDELQFSKARICETVQL